MSTNSITPAEEAITGELESEATQRTQAVVVVLQKLRDEYASNEEFHTGMAAEYARKKLDKSRTIAMLMPRKPAPDGGLSTKKSSARTANDYVLQALKDNPGGLTKSEVLDAILGAGWVSASGDQLKYVSKLLSDTKRSGDAREKDGIWFKVEDGPRPIQTTVKPKRHRSDLPLVSYIIGAMRALGDKPHHIKDIVERVSALGWQTSGATPPASISSKIYDMRGKGMITGDGVDGYRLVLDNQTVKMINPFPNGSA